MRCYQVDTETWKQIAVDLEQIAQWAELGARIDLDSMSDSELETSMEDVYLSFINTNPKNSTYLEMSVRMNDMATRPFQNQ